MLSRLSLGQLATTKFSRTSIQHFTRPPPTFPHFPIRPMSSSSLPTISLNASERELADLLTSCTAWIKSNPDQLHSLRTADPSVDWISELPSSLDVELRVAGGWVRDKLLGMESDDIDISVSPAPLTGLKFATLFEAYLDSIGRRDLMGKLTKIEAKPDQSKHLETATAHVCGLSVDWVQQRGHEIYTTGSRIPTVSFGTPLEDAQRRDLTINALFYNLNTRQIEDATGCGIPDLGLAPPAKRRIRTPLAPFETFRDDPLRVVRAVRFAARFGREFEVDAELREAIGREEIRAALRDGKKISRERVGVELEKMLLGKDPLYALELIDSLGLHELVFLYDHAQAFPASGTAKDAPAPAPDTSSTLQAARILASLLDPAPTTPALHPRLHAALSPPQADSTNSPSPRATLVKRLYLATALLPLYHLAAIDKKKVVWLGEKVVRDGVKLGNHDTEWQRRAREASAVLREGVQRLATGTDDSDRTEIGLLLRNANVHSAPHTQWEVSLFWSLVVELTGANGDRGKEIEIVAAYNAFVGRVLDLQLDTRAFANPILSGGDITALIPSIKSSPAITPVQAMVLKWQLSHPEGNAEQCEAYLKGDAFAEVSELVEKFKKPQGKKKQQQ